MELTDITLRQTTVNIRSHTKRWYDDTLVSDAEIETQSRFYFIKYGTMAYEIDGKKYTVKKNQLMLVPERRHVRFYVPKDQAAHVQMCGFNAEFKGETIFDYLEGEWHTDVPDPKAVNSLFERFHRVNEENIILDCLEKKTACMQILCIFLSGANLCVSKKHSERGRINFEGIADHIRRNANSKHQMTVENLAEMAHVNYNYFISEFHRYFGVSPMQYILDARIQSAKSMLEKTDAPIKSIAETMHFENVKYFSSFFKKRTGMTPREYRSSLKKDQ